MAFVEFQNVSKIYRQGEVETRALDLSLIHISMPEPMLQMLRAKAFLRTNQRSITKEMGNMVPRP